MSWFFASGGQSIGVSASTSVLPMNIQDWLDRFAVQATLKSLLQHHSSKASILWLSAFFIFLSFQFSHPNVTTGKTIVLTVWTFVSKVISLLFNTLSRFVIAFLPRRKCLNFVTAVTVHSDFGGQEKKICHCFHSPLYPGHLFAMK